MNTSTAAIALVTSRDPSVVSGHCYTVAVAQGLALRIGSKVHSFNRERAT